MNSATRICRSKPTQSRQRDSVGSSRSTARHGFAQAPTSIGVDVISVAEVSAALERFGQRYVRRVFTTHEAAYCRAAVAPLAAARFAARFAAKEAVIKALKPKAGSIGWRSIEIRRHPSGACDVVLHREAASLATRRGIGHFALSMTHEGEIAAAVVLAVRRRHHRRHAAESRHAS
jgi:holo-[acyl-carrier protein] synthase